jgi:hypothetical protein
MVKGLRMLEFCRNCPTFASCTEICKALERHLREGEGANEQEIPVSQLTDDKRGSDYDGETSPINPSELLDKKRKIDPAASYKNDTPQEIDWAKDDRPPSNIFVSDFNLLRRHIYMRVRNIKQRMRFYAFLNCAKIIEIARRANTTRQNIHKQFNRICYRVAKSIAQSAPSDRVYTPARLKKKYQELKPTP